MISIYTIGFNLYKGHINYVEALENFCKFADEVVLAVNDEDSFDVVEPLLGLPFKNFNNLRIIKTEISFDDPLCIGKIKNEALQSCTGNVLIQLDLDERIALRHKRKWEYLGKFLNQQNNPYKSVFVPVVNFYGDEKHYSDIGRKWYIHEKGLYRGAVNFGKKENGKINIKKTDTCEILDETGNLVLTQTLNQEAYTMKGLETDDYPFVYHLGYSDLSRRIKTNEFWKDHLKVRTGEENKERNRTLEELKNKKVFKHNLKLWEES